MRGRLQRSIAVVRGGAAAKMMEEHAHHEHAHHDDDESQEFLTVEESVVTDALSQIRAGVLEAANPVGDMVDALGSQLTARAAMRLSGPARRASSRPSARRRRA